MSTNQRNIIIGLIIAVVCALSFYFFYWVKTPLYSVNLIRESVEKHDVVQFKKHVDMDTLYGKAIEDMLIAVDKIEGTEIMSNPFSASIVEILKEPAVELLKGKDALNGNEILILERNDRVGKKLVATGNGQGNLTNARFGEEFYYGDRFSEELKEKADAENIELKDISVIEERGNRALIAIKLYNSELGKNFILKVKMNKLVDGTWRIKEITNLVDYFLEVDKAQKEKLIEAR